MDINELDNAVATTTRLLTKEAIKHNIDFDYVGHRGDKLEEIMYTQVQNLLITNELLQATSQ